MCVSVCVLEHLRHDIMGQVRWVCVWAGYISSPLECHQGQDGARLEPANVISRSLVHWDVVKPSWALWALTKAQWQTFLFEILFFFLLLLSLWRENIFRRMLVQNVKGSCVLYRDLRVKVKTPGGGHVFFMKTVSIVTNDVANPLVLWPIHECFINGILVSEGTFLICWNIFTWLYWIVSGFFHKGKKWFCAKKKWFCACDTEFLQTSG